WQRWSGSDEDLGNSDMAGPVHESSRRSELSWLDPSTKAPIAAWVNDASRMLRRWLGLAIKACSTADGVDESSQFVRARFSPASSYWTPAAARRLANTSSP